jgi:hypothetical protein
MSHAYDLNALQQRAASSDFFQSLLIDYTRFGGLTLAQIGVLNQQPVTTPPVAARHVDTTALERAFATAKASGVKQPSVTLFGFKFMPADPDRASAANKEAIFVTQQAPKGTTPGAYLGKVLRGQFFAAGACTPTLAQSVRDAMEDPYKAAVEYGHMTGECSVCRRPLSNPESVKLGIGPVCRARFGW